MILIVTKDQMEADRIAAILADKSYTGEALPSIESLESRLHSGCRAVVLIDIDSVPVDSRYIRNLTLKHPSITIFCMSRDKLHPELKEAISHHVYACLSMPIDSDELIYWMRCIDHHRNESRGPP